MCELLTHVLKLCNPDLPRKIRFELLLLWFQTLTSTTHDGLSSTFRWRSKRVENKYQVVYKKKKKIIPTPSPCITKHVSRMCHMYELFIDESFFLFCDTRLCSWKLALSYAEEQNIFCRSQFVSISWNIMLVYYGCDVTFVYYSYCVKRMVTAFSVKKYSLDFNNV